MKSSREYVRLSTKRVSVCVILVVACSLSVAANTLGPGSMLVPPDITPGSVFGFSVAASGSLLAVGAPLNGSGAVYIYQQNGDNWVQQAKLTVAQGPFGGTLALDGSTLISNGHVFVNKNGGWTEQAQLPSGSVAISGNTIAVGTTNVVYVFLRSESVWTQQAAIPLSDNSAIVNVALQNDTLLVGEPNVGSATGMARVFGRQNGVWTQQAVLTASDAQEVSFFGFGLSISGNTIAIGAPGQGVFEDQPGSAYIFVNNNGAWMQEAEVFGSGTLEGSDFGTSLALVGNTLLVGAYDDGANDEGTAHIFVGSGSTWVDRYVIAPGINGIPGPGTPGQRFANAVTMAGSNTFIIGSPLFSSPVDVTDTFHIGAVYSITVH